jgi:NADH-quinone oxidoreductase subunit L
MPLIRTTFVIGALALAGLPILNGFWSKELVLEAGLSGGPLWAWVVMLAGAGLTALYTYRVVWLVFFGTPRSATNAHDAAPFMRISLIILAFGTLTTWLLAGPFSQQINAAFAPYLTEAQYEAAPVLSTLQMVLEVLTAPATWIALVVIALGLAAWWWRAKLVGVGERLRWLATMATDSFGFEWINRSVVRVTLKCAETLRVTQTGVLNWNILGIVGGLIFVLAVIIMGAAR